MDPHEVHGTLTSVIGGGAMRAHAWACDRSLEQAQRALLIPFGFVCIRAILTEIARFECRHAMQFVGRNLAELSGTQVSHDEVHHDMMRTRACAWKILELPNQLDTEHMHERTSSSLQFKLRYSIYMYGAARRITYKRFFTCSSMCSPGFLA